jgi:CubicO group peptidase (beta-lactamase class C family)
VVPHAHAQVLKLVAATFLALCCTGAALAAAPPLVDSPARASAVPLERMRPVRDFLREATRRDYLGAVALVAGEVAPATHYSAVLHAGHRDLARTRPQREDDLFAIFSLTKPITTAAMMLLVDEGRVDLDAPVARYLPEMARIRAKQPITVRHLLTHTAGFGGDKEELERKAGSLAQYVEVLSRLPLSYEPGTRFLYDSANSEVAARLVEVVSGERFGAFLQERLFAPLGMADTAFAVPEAKRDRLAAMTSTDATGNLVAWRTIDARRPGDSLRAWESGAGGLYSTVPDYYRFARMLLEGGTHEGRRILSSASVKAMMTHQLASLDPPVSQYGEGFGLGGFVNLDRPGRERPGSVGAWGWSGAAGTYFMIDPMERLVMILFTQHQPQGLPNDPKKLSFRFYNLVYQSLGTPR